MFGSGRLTAPLLLVGDSPGANDEVEGLPFWGEGGRLLRNYLHDLDMGPDVVFLTNLVRCRVPPGQELTGTEVLECRSHLNQTIALLKPKLVLALGGFAGVTLSGEERSIGWLRDKEDLTYKGIPGLALPLRVTYHPNYVFRAIGVSHSLKQDLLLAKTLIQEQSGDQTQ